jgi:hypothetical protein
VLRWKVVLRNAYPYLIASYPVLALYAENADQVQASAVLRPLAGSLLLAWLLVTGLRWLLRLKERAALAASLMLAAFFSYGHVYTGLKQLGPLGLALARHRYLLPILLASLVLLLWGLSRAHSLRQLPLVMNVFALALLSLPVMRTSAYLVEARLADRAVEQRDYRCGLAPPADEELPDIYLIIMDAYERDDVLWEMHGYDNSPFLEGLQAMGFYVARGSLSNYRHTEMTLASLLNMDYLDRIPESYSGESLDRNRVVYLIRDSRLRRELECLGYQIVAFETGVFWTEWKDADIFIARQAGGLQQLQVLGGLTRFEALLLRNTLARALLDLTSRLQSATEGLSNDPVDEHRKRVLFELEQLGPAAALPSPKFVFVHVVSPHPPFVFGPNGEPVNEAEFETDPSGQPVRRSVLYAYADQVTFLNGMLLEGVRAIKSKSEVPPIIIIQGDHGWADRDQEDKLSILNAYHLPDGGEAALYPTITPVNSFRHILDYYFGGSYGFLEDSSYYSPEEAPFQFVKVVNTWSADTSQPTP